jgi:two-component system, NtrC family, nitrogen regulation sensor histidine kinase NtrY
MTARPGPQGITSRRRRVSLAGRVALLVGGVAAVSVALALMLHAWLGDALLAGVLTLLVMLPVTLYAAHNAMALMTAMFRALAGTATSYRDGDFAFSLHWPRNDELADLVAAHNELGTTLREQRQALVQRELLLDTMVQNTPVAMFLCDPSERIVYANLAARKLLYAGRRMEGVSLPSLLEAAPEALRVAVDSGGDGLFALPGGEEGDDAYHLARREFRLNGRRHELFLLRYLTVELRRQEVATWKRVIRVISHELNNSLAPIASLAHSGGELVRREQYHRLEEIFATIEDRARHLESFILGYARFAKLPAPRPESVSWPDFLARLRSQIEFRLVGHVPDAPARFDPAQLEQALLNLLGNAHESGSGPSDVELRVRHGADSVYLEVADRGRGMTEQGLTNALLPFYSEKRGGTGLGLALVREIAEAHGGHVALANRVGGGLSVTVVLPA